jgi:hypothetical protein
MSTEISSLRVTTLAQRVGGYTTSVVALDAQHLGDITVAHARTEKNAEFMRTEAFHNFQGGVFQDAWMGRIGSLDAARALFTKGWREGAERADTLKAQVGDVVPNSTAPVRRRRVRDEGDELRLDQALQGEWDTAYWSSQRVDMPAPNVVSLTAGWIAMSYVEHEQLIWNAVQAIVLCDLLEQNGYRVELRALDVVVTGRQNLHITEMLMKRSSEPLQPDLIAAMIGHAGVYRSLGFAAMCLHPTDTDDRLGREPGANLRKEGIEAAISAEALQPISYRLPRADSLDACLKNITKAFEALHVTARNDN